MKAGPGLEGTDPQVISSPGHIIAAELLADLLDLVRVQFLHVLVEGLLPSFS